MEADEGQQQLLPDQRRQYHVLPHAHPHALLPAYADVPLLSRGLMIPDLIAILGSIDYVLADVDR